MIVIFINAAYQNYENVLFESISLPGNFIWGLMPILYPAGVKDFINYCQSE